MAESSPSPETPLWRFSLHFYRQAGVSDACIALQDECGVDVNLLLFLLWLAAGRRQLSMADVKRLDEAVRGWRDLTIVPIRDARRKLKGAATLVEAQKQEAFRTKVKAIELEAERLQQEALFGLTRTGPLGGEAAPGEAARANIAAYEGALDARFPKRVVDALAGAFDTVPHGSFAAQ
ncbi:MAG: TIGR02444 family protein [Xanthobacteraceae bacterium]